MKKVLIVGGGFAGLSAAVYLSEKNFDITLLEASPLLGGRAKAVASRVKSEKVDNGQHLLIGAYSETLKFLNKINALANFERFPRLLLPFLERGGRYAYLHIRSPFYPLNLFSASMRFNAIALRKRVKMLLPFVALKSLNETFAENSEEWLKNLKQDNDVLKVFWNVLGVSALNAPLATTDVGVFKRVLSEIFLKGNKAFEFILPAKNLTEAYVLPAVNFIKSRGGKIYTSEKVTKLTVEKNRVKELFTVKNRYNDFDFLILAIPFSSTVKILEWRKSPEYKESPIVNVHLWLKENPLTCKYAALIDSEFDWLFSAGNRLTLVKSAAFKLVNSMNSKIEKLALKELREFIPLFHEGLVEGVETIKEKRATFVPSTEFERARRKFSYRPFRNLFLAGDWTTKGFPATIEGAVRSGVRVVNEILKASF
jgi:zeta-carotene desaturase